MSVKDNLKNTFITLFGLQYTQCFVAIGISEIMRDKKNFKWGTS